MREKLLKPREWLAPLAIVALYLVLAIDGIGEKSLWTDEGFSIRDAREISDFNLARPGYFILLRGWLLLGEGVVHMRVLTIIVGALAILAIYFLARAVFDKPWPAALAALSLCLSSRYVFLSQTVRGYTLITLCAILHMAAFHWLTGRFGFARLAAYWLVTLASIFVTPIIAFLNVAQGLWVAVFHRRDFRFLAWYMGTGLVTLAALSPFLLLVLEKKDNTAGTGWLNNCYRPLLLDFDPAGFLDVTGRLVMDDIGSGAFSMFIGGLILAAAGFGAFRHFHNKEKEPLLLAAYIIVPLAGLTILSNMSQNVFHQRIFYYILPAFVLLFGYMASKLPIAAGAPLMAAYLGLNSFGLYHHHGRSSFHGEDWKSAWQYIKSNSTNKDVVFLYPQYVYQVNSFYNTDNLTIMTVGDIAAAGKSIERDPRDFQKYFLLVLRRHSDGFSEALEVENLPGYRGARSFDKVFVFMGIRRQIPESRNIIGENECFLARDEALRPAEMKALARMFEENSAGVVWSAGPGCGDQQGEWTASDAVSGKVPWDETRRRLGWWSLEGDTDCGGGSPWIQLEGPLDSGTFTTLHFRCNSLGGSHGVGVWERVGCDLQVFAAPESNDE